MLICSSSFEVSRASLPRKTEVSLIFLAHEYQAHHDFEGPRRSIVVIGGLFWKPFDSRFEDLLAALDTHHDVIVDEIRIGTFTGFQQAQARAETEQRAQSESRRKVENVEKLLQNSPAQRGAYIIIRHVQPIKR